VKVVNIAWHLPNEDIKPAEKAVIDAVNYCAFFYKQIPPIN
jgi:hypothetical protein